MEFRQKEKEEEQEEFDVGFKIPDTKTDRITEILRKEHNKLNELEDPKKKKKQKRGKSIICCCGEEGCGIGPMKERGY